MEAQGVWVIVPVKTLAEAKSRLSPVLSVAQRRQLAFQMAEHTLSTLNHLLKKNLIAGFVTVSRDPLVKSLTHKYNGVYLPEELAENSQKSGLNAALSQAARWCTANYQPASLLILHSDLPFLHWEDLAHLLRDAQKHPEQPLAVISPDRRGRGTNCLLLRPPDLLDFEFLFGENSFFKYQNIFLNIKGLQPLIYPLPNLGFDLDYPEDLAALARTQAGPAQGCQSTAI
jgi:2-phospho-L-lactate guanylyltransferase